MPHGAVDPSGRGAAVLGGGELTKALAREWGAILQFGKQEVPFNLIAFGSEVNGEHGYHGHIGFVISHCQGHGTL